MIYINKNMLTFLYKHASTNVFLTRWIYGRSNLKKIIN